MANDFPDDERHEGFRKFRIEIGFFSQSSQPRNLFLLAFGVCRLQIMFSFQFTHLLGLSPTCWVLRKRSANM